MFNRLNYNITFHQSPQNSWLLCISQLYSGIQKDQLNIGNPNTCAEVKLRLLLFMPTLEIVCRETEAFNTVISG